MIKVVSGPADPPVVLSNLTSHRIHCPGIGNQHNRVTKPGRMHWEVRFKRVIKRGGDVTWNQYTDSTLVKDF